MALTKDEIIEELETMSVLELVELVKALEEQLGVLPPRPRRSMVAGRRRRWRRRGRCAPRSRPSSTSC